MSYFYSSARETVLATELVPMDKTFRLSLKKRESFLPTQFVQLLKTSSKLSHRRMQGETDWQLDVSSIRSMSSRRKYLQKDPQAQMGDCASLLLRGFILLKPESNPFHTYAVE